jgi:hypothetical protein
MIAVNLDDTEVKAIPVRQGVRAQEHPPHGAGNYQQGSERTQRERMGTHGNRSSVPAARKLKGNMSEPTKVFGPRPHDLPRDDLLKLAQYALRDGGGFENATVYFKFTCRHCGTRCTLTEPFLLREKGECCECGKVTVIEYGGLALWNHNHEQDHR